MQAILPEATICGCVASMWASLRRRSLLRNIRHGIVEPAEPQQMCLAGSRTVKPTCASSACVRCAAEAMLHRAGEMIGYRLPGLDDRRLEAKVHQHFRDIVAQRRDPGGAFASWIVAQQCS